MLTVDDDDFDCTPILALPGEPAAEESTEEGEGCPAKRAKQGSPLATKETYVACRASSVALKQHSEVFRSWMKGWLGRKKQKAKHVLRIECEDRQEAASFQQLLDYVHSAGHVLPSEPGGILALLAVARKHAAEACVDACLQLLPTKLDQMPLHQCLRLLLLLETGTSGKDDVQANADRLFRRGAERLSMLLKDKAAVMAANAALQAELAEFFGRWHSMLNCDLRCNVWQCLPFDVLLLMFEDCHVHADTEATVLAAFAAWANANMAAGSLSEEAHQGIAAIFSRIRFPELLPDVVLNYWACFGWLQQFDGTRELPLRAIFHPGNIDQAASEPVYWRGYFWQCKLGMSVEGATVVSISTGCSADLARFAGYAAGAFPYQTQAVYRIRLQSNGSSQGSLDPLQGTGVFSPAAFFNRGACHELETTTWERFWAADSPLVRDGRVAVELTLSVPPS
ncbi:hypothetical protein COHA_004273 [Chlorella ohadii]|uniref:BTB domain-containing protein n=1 Tax=Chlorella ohadii TaxID=2649997 RepID=A0AAD5H7C3_9CHLO|nr:hypothetical protein COHA_004273 [Chlorella ohadii]